MYCIYKLTNRVSGMSYIGITKTSLKVRCAGHRQAAGRGLTYPIAEAIRTDGWASFQADELGRVETLAEAYEREKAAIVLFRTLAPTGYNQAPGGPGLSGYIVTEATREKLRGQRLGQPGHIPNAETRRKMAESHRGAKNWQARAIELDGVTYPSPIEAARALGLSVSSIRYRLKAGFAQHVAPRKVWQGAGLWNRGKTASPETRAKMSASRKGAKNWNARVVEIGGVQYPSTTDAMAATGLNRSQIRWRIKRGDARFLTETKRVHPKEH